MIYIILFILILHVVLILSTYHNCNTLEQKNKLLFILVGIGGLYLITSVVFGISQRGMDYGNAQAQEMVKNFIIFTFVPINGLVTMPIIAYNYNKYNVQTLKKDAFRNRMILLGIVFVILLIIEGFYMKSIGISILDMAKSMKQ